MLKKDKKQKILKLVKTVKNVHIYIQNEHSLKANELEDRHRLILHARTR